MNELDNNDGCKYIQLQNKRNQALANFLCTLTKKQFILFTHYQKQEEKLRKQYMINLANSLLKTNKKH